MPLLRVTIEVSSQLALCPTSLLYSMYSTVNVLHDRSVCILFVFLYLFAQLQSFVHFFFHRSSMRWNASFVQPPGVPSLNARQLAKKFRSSIGQLPNNIICNNMDLEHIFMDF